MSSTLRRRREAPLVTPNLVLGQQYLFMYFALPSTDGVSHQNKFVPSGVDVELAALPLNLRRCLPGTSIPHNKREKLIGWGL